MAPDEPLISFVIPVRNDPGALRACLASIAGNDYPPDRMEVLVADNGSTDATPAVAARAGATVLSFPGVPVAEVRNQAASRARGEILAFVDADHRIEGGWIRSAVEALQVPGVVAAGAPYHAPRHGTWVQRMYDAFRQHTDDAGDVEWLGSGNMAVRRQAFTAARGFDAGLVTCEDVDLCQRLRRNGGRIRLAPHMHTTHDGDPATLKALFFGELWRGRDNLRASLRASLTWRGLPSLLIPVFDLLLMAAAVLGLATASAGGLWLTAAALAAMVVLAGLRAVIMMQRLSGRSVREAAQALAVAFTYDVARALAPVWRGTHAGRRRAGVR